MNLREAWIPALVALALVALGFGIGRYSVPTRVEEKLKVVEVEKQVVVVQEKVRVERVEVKSEVSALRRVRRESVKPDGSVERETITSRDSQATATTQEAAARSSEKAVSAITSREAEQTRIVVRDPPSWRVEAAGGVVLPSPRLRVALAGSHRFWGPVWLGAELGVLPPGAGPLQLDVSGRLGVEW